MTVIDFLRSRLDLTAQTRFMGERKLIKEGALGKRSGRKLHGYLCNDILVLTHNTLLYHVVRWHSFFPFRSRRLID